MYVSARTDYALRAMLAVTAVHSRLVKAAELAAAQDIPLSFLQGILLDLRRAELLHSTALSPSSPPLPGRSRPPIR